MKFKAVFSLAIVLIILFSIGMVAAADDNTTEPLCEVEEIENDTLELADEPCLIESSNQPVELFVDMTSDCDSYVVQNDTVKWTITVKSKGGTARNTILYTRFNGVKQISHYTKTGTYDKNSQVWKIGNLAPNKVASLTIKTKATRNLGDIYCEALATTSSNKEYKTNEFGYSNYALGEVFVGDPERSITNFNELVASIRGNNNHSNYTSDVTESDDIRKGVHQEHYFSTEHSQKTDFYSSSKTESFNERVNATSSYNSVETYENTSNSQYNSEKNTTHTPSNADKNTSHSQPDNPIKSDSEPFSLRKSAVYLSENKFSLAIAALALIILIGAVYKKRS